MMCRTAKRRAARGKVLALLLAFLLTALPLPVAVAQPDETPAPTETQSATPTPANSTASPTAEPTDSPSPEATATPTSKPATPPSPSAAPPTAKTRPLLGAPNDVCKIGATTYATLAAAVAAAVDNDVIELIKPTLSITAPITIPANLHLTIKPASGITSAVISVSGLAGSDAFTIAANAGLTITGPTQDSVVLDGSASTSARAIKNAGDLTLHNATIRKFTYAPAGIGLGGAALYSTGDVVISGHSKITRNAIVTHLHAWTVGAIMTYGGTLLICDDAEITENIGRDGGGIAVGGPIANRSTVTVRDNALIARNYATGPGGGIYIYAQSTAVAGSGTLNIEGGTITGNFAAAFGGAGVFVHVQGVVNLTGGTITGNYTANANGAGISYYDASATVNIHGDPVLDGNFKGANFNTTTFTITPISPAPSNLFITNGANVTIDGNLSPSAKIGITTNTRNTIGAVFGTRKPAGSNYNNLDRLVNDVDYGLFGVKSGTSDVSWDGSCQIIRGGTFIAKYGTINSAVAAALDGDRIEMLVPEYAIKSPCVIPAGKNLTLGNSSTCPATTFTAYGIGTTYWNCLRVNAGAGLVLDGRIVGGVNSLIFDGSEQGSDNVRCLYNEGTLTVTNTTIQNFRYAGGTSDGGAGLHSKGTTTLNGKTIIRRNTSGVGMWTSAGISVFGGTTLLCDDVQVVENSAYDDGGIGVGGGGKVTLRDNVLIARNYASMPGGGVYLYADALGGTLTMEGGTITGNFSAYGGGGIAVHEKSTLNLVGGQIFDNAVTVGAGGGGVLVLRPAAVVNIKGSPVVKNNVSGGKWDSTTFTFTKPNPRPDDVYLVAGAYVKVNGNLTQSAEIGVRAGDDARNAVGKQFGIIVPSGSQYYGYERFFNNKTPTLYGMQNGSTDEVVWGVGTCQIIRDIAGVPTFMGLYQTLFEACNAAQAGDIIEVYRSHTVKITALADVDDLTIRTAPTTTPTVAGAKLFVPVGGETNRASVKREANTGVLLDMVGADDLLLDNLIFDGIDKASTSPLLRTGSGTTVQAHNCVIQNAMGGGLLVRAGTTTLLDDCLVTQNNDAVSVQGALTLKDTTITDNTVTQPTGGTCVVSGVGQLTVTGQVEVYDNLYLQRQCNVRLAEPNGLVAVRGGLSAGSHIGVSVKSNDEHILYHEVARGFESNGTTPSTAVAAAAQPYFSDDFRPTLQIGANAIPEAPGLDTYLYFMPPFDYEFYKISDEANGFQPVAGAQFRIYAYNDVGVPGTAFMTEAALQASPQWTQVGGTYTSDSDGLVEVGLLGNGYYRILETLVPANYSAYDAQWQLKLDSSSPGSEFVYTPIKQNVGDSACPFTAVPLENGGYRNELQNVYGASDLKVKKLMAGRYADLTRACSFTGRVWNESGVTPVTTTYTAQRYNSANQPVGAAFTVTYDTAFTFALRPDEHLIVTGLPVGISTHVQEEAIGGYAVTVTAAVPSSAPPLTVDNDERTAEGKLETGLTTITYTNTHLDAAPTGASLPAAGLGAALLLTLGVVGLLLLFKRYRPARQMGKFERR